MNFCVYLQYILYYCITILLMNNVRPMLADDDAILRPCGQYGFRCIGTQTFEICPLKEDGGVTEEPASHDCKDDLVCDEDNPAYCTPIEPLLKVQNTGGVRLHHRHHSSQLDDEENLNYDFDQHNDYNEPQFDDYFNGIRNERSTSSQSSESSCSSCTSQCSSESARPQKHEDCNSCEATTTTTTELPPTMPPDPSPTPMSFREEYNCANYGFFPDSKNASQFWYCDVPQDGNGFISKHMICGDHRIFVKDLNACVLKGTTPQVRRQAYRPSIVSEEYHEDTTFKCNGKKTGKYAHAKDCRFYYICVNERNSPVKEILFSCGKNMAFDPGRKKCTRKSIARCSYYKKKPKTSASTICRTPCRFRNANNCKGYYFCTGKQVLKLQCPQSYKFDDITLECLPNRDAKCSTQFP